MALTITEAAAANTVLNYLYGLPGPTGQVPTQEATQWAAELLATAAHKRLVAGLDDVAVSNAQWDIGSPGTGYQRGEP